MSPNQTLSHDEARRFYDRFGAKQDKQAWYEDAALDDLIRHADIEHACAVYEFGCGTGRLAERLLSSHMRGDSWYRGVDVSRQMIDLARTRLQSYGDRVQLEQSDGTIRLDAPDSSVDCVVATYVLDLLSLEDIGAFLLEARRVLTDDGRLCVAGLTVGPTPVSRVVSWVWSRVHRIRPRLVGGCRPIRVREMLSDNDWVVRRHTVVMTWGIPSEVLVATPRPDRNAR